MELFERPGEERKRRVRRNRPVEAGQTLKGFVLLRKPECDFPRFIRNLKNDWDIEATALPNRGSIRFEADGLQISCFLIHAPLPGNEVKACCGVNPLWPEAEESLGGYQAHVVVSVSGVTDPLGGHVLFTQVLCSMLKQEDALALYMPPMTMSAEAYVTNAMLLKEGELPVQLWVFIGLYEEEQGISSYTVGLRNFGHDEIEVLRSRQDLVDVFELTFNIVGYIVDCGATLKDGETIGFSCDQRLPLKLSPGIAVEGQSIKIGY
ncbi:DUF4261 domain-containing protein [Saccharibacillus kuerlensis]|uniref:DUF4261 domain-containing protein n=1 Tax=Saccharibacillus kuerlensis TaxID=459527 RepID=A0ABQ2L077_9BACL|nr:DUF4261 domain-containing protein [Saccharibacillus kuerlensis]GGN98229.1 hypothetical protein GCM10010969_17050 [Saccharibacillus kuerlensis]